MTTKRVSQRNAKNDEQEGKAFNREDWCLEGSIESHKDFPKAHGKAFLKAF